MLYNKLLRSEKITRYVPNLPESKALGVLSFLTDHEPNMEVGLAAQVSLFIPATSGGLREGEVRVGSRPSHAEAVAFTSCKRVSRAFCSRLSGLLSLAGIAKVAHAFSAGFCVPHVAVALLIIPSVSASPNKAFKNVRFAHWDWRSASPLISR